jgi:hypothetical protein
MNDLDAAIAILDERIELLGIGLSVYKERISLLGEKITILQMELDMERYLDE